MSAAGYPLRGRLDVRGAAELAEEHLQRDRQIFYELEHPSLAVMRRVVSSLASSVEALNREARLTGPLGETVTRLTLADLKPVIHLASHRLREAALEITLNWDRALGGFLSEEGEADLRESLRGFTFGIELDADVVRDAAWPLAESLYELSDTYFLALFERDTGVRAVERGRASLRRLAVHLELSQNELGRMLGVSGETVRRWEAGAIRVPTERLAQLTQADAELRRLQVLLRPETLPQVIRRPADLFGGERALDWILRGKIHDVATSYELALRYQG
jgi:transcriptional regulator with XRE-family HTH domain